MTQEIIKALVGTLSVFIGLCSFRIGYLIATAKSSYPGPFENTDGHIKKGVAIDIKDNRWVITKELSDRGLEDRIGRS